jgi:hypothetical protein
MLNMKTAVGLLQRTWLQSFPTDESITILEILLPHGKIRGFHVFTLVICTPNSSLNTAWQLEAVTLKLRGPEQRGFPIVPSSTQVWRCSRLVGSRKSPTTVR